VIDRLRYGVVISCTLLSLALGHDSLAASDSLFARGSKAGQGEMVIRSNMLEADDTKGVVIFTGDVEAKRDDFTVFCQSMTVYYEKAPERKGAGDVEGRIDKIVATGEVRIVRAEGGTATGEKAVYYQQDEKIVLTGNPIVKQKENSVEGDRITLFLNENRSVVESSSDKKVKAVIFPSKDKEKGL